MPPPLSDTLAGLTLTLMGGVVVFVVEPPPPPPQPAKKAKVDNPLKTAARPKRTDMIPFPDIGLSKTSCMISIRILFDQRLLVNYVIAVFRRKIHR
jgi:hypothetical protein